MKHLTTLLLAAAPLAFGCSSAQQDDEASRPTVGVPDSGTPELSTVEEAVAFAVLEENLVSYSGVVFGSEHYEVTLPSGRVTDNWTIDCYFRDLFRPFGTDAFDELAPLLDHEYEFVQVGAYSVLNSYMHAHGLKRHARQSESERLATMERLKEILEEEGI